MKTISELLLLSTDYLCERGIPRARRIAEELLAACLCMKRVGLYMHFERPVIEDEMVLFRERLKKCARGEPLEYAIGELDFYDCTIAVDRRVLIPRPETEILVDLIVKKISRLDLKDKTCWDVCAGSGCIGIALKKALPALQMTLSDVSQDALDLSCFNAKINQVEVSLACGDLLGPLEGKTIDFFVCNPPYISRSEYLNLEGSVRNFEPQGALVGGERGTEFYERLAAGLPTILNSGAQVFLEIGANQGDRVKEIFTSAFWVNGEVGKDWAGHDRFFFLEKQ